MRFFTVLSVSRSIGLLLTEQSDPSLSWTCKGFLLYSRVHASGITTYRHVIRSQTCLCVLLYMCINCTRTICVLVKRFKCVLKILSVCLCMRKHVCVCVCQKHLETRRCDFTGCDRMKYCSEKRERRRKTTDGATLS